jgi:Type VI secretion system/phage-baseplate injector OB domain
MYTLTELLTTGSHARTYPGLYAATVTNIDDPDKRGRVKVRVPSVFGTGTSDLDAWARPCFSSGHFFVPDVGNHVWVAFENADPSFPVWIGEWYPAGALPEGTDVTPPTTRVVEDATGNRVELTPNGIVLHAAGDLTIEAPGKNIVIRASSVDVRSG